MKNSKELCCFIIMILFIFVALYYGFYRDGTNELLSFIASSIWFLILDLNELKE